jgi:hypothetical protein
MLVEMTRSRFAAVVCVAVAVHVTAAALPHVHADEGVRVGALHLDHGEAAGDGSCVMPPQEVVAASSCLACAVHAPQLTAPVDSAPPFAVPEARCAADSGDLIADPPRPWTVHPRGPPLVV